MNKVIYYFQSSYRELIYKVSWPSVSSLQRSAAITIMILIIIMLVVWLMDATSSFILTQHYNNFSR